MNKRQATQKAHSIVASLIQNYFDVGQPYDEMQDAEKDADRLFAALERIQLHPICRNGEP